VESVNRTLRSLIDLIPEKKQVGSLKIAEVTAGNRQAEAQDRKENIKALGFDPINRDGKE
jgi:hypothetical protein